MLETISPQVIVAVISAGLTAAVTLLSVHLANKGQINREKIQYEREKKQKTIELSRENLEELYIIFSKWKTDLNSSYVLFFPVFAGNMSSTDAWDISNKNKLSEHGAFNRIEMIIHIYFPELIEDLNIVLKARDVASQFITDMRPRPSNKQKFAEAVESFEKTSNEFLGKVANKANAL